ncbi:MAG: site-specific integrase [Desulfovibrionaceae bacterium]|nr:site-specific integrase [Desulfovibrionaceae bacterium]
MKWISTQFPGVRYREHATRKARNGQPDRYYTLRYRVNGQRKEEPIGWSSEGWNPEKAYKVLSGILSGVRTGEGPQSLAEKRQLAAEAKAAEEEAKRRAQISDMTLKAFFDEIYLPRIQREKRSWKDDKQRIQKITPVLGEYPLSALRADDVQVFLDGLADAGMAPATVRQYMAVIRHAFNIAAETSIEGVTLFAGKNPAVALRLPTLHNSRERYLTAEEADRLIQAAAELRSPDLHDAIILSLNTGLRLGELLRLRWLDVDLCAGIVTVPDEDMRKPGGKVPVNTATRAVLLCRREMQEARPESRIFPPVGAGASRENLSHVFREIVERLGINEGITDPRQRIVFHSLRHTFASWLALAGVDIYRIKTLMRHKTISMTMRYAHLIPDATRDAVHNLKPPRL